MNLPYGYHWRCQGCGMRLNATQFPVQCPGCGAAYGVQHVSGPNVPASLPPGILAPMPRPARHASSPEPDPEPATLTEAQRRTAHRLLVEALDG
jgi:tRNA(Ile2) C34 agmatinyltransferase TiaS